MSGMGRRSSWRCSAERRRRGRLRHAGSRASECGVSGCSGQRKPDDPDVKERYAAFVQRLQQLGWSDGRNLRIDAHSTASEPDDLRKRAAELVALAPDVILAGGTSTVAPLLQATRTVPIVFAGTADPVGAGLVASFARPGGNVTGFMQFEYSFSATWLELLKQIAPSVTRAAVLRDPVVTAGIGQFAVIQSAAPSVGIDVSPVNVRIAQEIEQAVTAFAPPQWRTDRDRERAGGGPSRSDHHPGGPAQAAGGLRAPALCRRGRADVLWTRSR